MIKYHISIPFMNETLCFTKGESITGNIDRINCPKCLKLYQQKEVKEIIGKMSKSGISLYNLKLQLLNLLNYER